MPALIALVFTIGIAMALPKRDAQATIAKAGGGEAFSEERLAALRAEGKPVFVYFTADWCLTCKVNEKVAIEREEVTTAFGKAGVATLVGDWTRGDPVISRFLSAHGRSGVPYYLFYAPKAAEGQELPQVLTPSILLSLANESAS